jgi:hypothetical protein
MCGSPLREKQRLVVACAVENMHHFDSVWTNAIENQVIAERTSTDAKMFVARHQRIAAWRIRQRLTLFSQFLHKIKCDFDALLSNVGRDLFQVRFASSVTTTINAGSPWP